MSLDALQVWIPSNARQHKLGNSVTYRSKNSKWVYKLPSFISTQSQTPFVSQSYPTPSYLTRYLLFGTSPETCTLAGEDDNSGKTPIRLSFFSLLVNLLRLSQLSWIQSLPLPRNTQRNLRLNDQENKNQARMDIRNPLSILIIVECYVCLFGTMYPTLEFNEMI
ncbi:hypothetical protein Hanom_Chr09g00868561 [Helianthus anomalus]